MATFKDLYDSSRQSRREAGEFDLPGVQDSLDVREHLDSGGFQFDVVHKSDDSTYVPSAKSNERSFVKLRRYVSFSLENGSPEPSIAGVDVEEKAFNTLARGKTIRDWVKNQLDNAELLSKAGVFLNDEIEASGCFVQRRLLPVKNGRVLDYGKVRSQGQQVLERRIPGEWSFEDRKLMIQEKSVSRMTGSERDKDFLPRKTGPMVGNFEGVPFSQSVEGHKVMSFIAGRGDKKFSIIMDASRTEGKDNGKTYSDMLAGAQRMLQVHGEKPKIEAQGDFVTRPQILPSGEKRDVREFRATHISLSGIDENGKERTLSVGFDSRAPLSKTKRGSRNDDPRY